MDQVWSTACRIDIAAPNAQRFTFESIDVANDAMLVETHKDVAEACGSFTLHLAPRRQEDGRTWDQIIPMRSLVFIDMRRDAADQFADAERTVMVGLTDDHGATADYSRATPQCRITIRGREISGVLLDAMLWYHPRLASDPATGTLTVHSATVGPQQLALTWNPKLARAGEDPRVILKRILDYFLFVGGSVVEPPDTPGLQQPIINLDLPEVKLADLLQSESSQWNTFEPVTVPIVHHTVMVGSIWNYLHSFIDGAFQEFFTRIDEGVCKIVFRGKPFQHKVITAGTRFKTSEDEPTLQTLILDPAWILATNLHRQSQQVYNVFLAVPLGITQYFDDPNFLYKVLPQIITDVEHPSFVGRYGLRILAVHSPYLSPLPPEATSSATPTPLTPPPAGAATYAAMAGRIAAEEGVPPQHVPWFVGLIHQESGFNPTATSPVKNGLTDKGIAQFSDGTAAQMGLTNPYDPVASLHAAARYWNVLRASPGVGEDPERVAAAYNAGPGAVQAAHGVPASAAKHVRYVMKYQALYADMAGTATAPGPPSTTSGAQGALQAIVATAERWGAILRAWYDMGGEFFSGTITVLGHPVWNIGHRLLCRDERGPWEAYIEGVTHQYDFRTGQYVTTLRITRGWYLTEAIAEQIRTEGKTTITSATGGPPSIDPEHVPVKELDITIVGPPDLLPRIID